MYICIYACIYMYICIYVYTHTPYYSDPPPLPPLSGPRWHNSSGGLAARPFHRGDLRSAYQEGFRRRLWHPEYHGRSHFDHKAWVAYLREGDTVTSAYFEAGMTYYHYGAAWEEGGRRGFCSTHSEYVSDDKRFTVSGDALLVPAGRHGVGGLRVGTRFVAISL